MRRAADSGVRAHSDVPVYAKQPQGALKVIYLPAEKGCGCVSEPGREPLDRSDRNNFVVFIRPRWMDMDWAPVI